MSSIYETSIGSVNDGFGIEAFEILPPSAWSVKLNLSPYVENIKGQVHGNKVLKEENFVLSNRNSSPELLENSNFRIVFPGGRQLGQQAESKNPISFLLKKNKMAFASKLSSFSSTLAATEAVIDLQTLRDEVRAMVDSGKPFFEIPLYKGRIKDGDPVAFLLKHYSRYLGRTDWDVLYLHDLRYIDPKLTSAIDQDPQDTKKVIKPKSAIFAALKAKAFIDGSKTATERRVKYIEQKQAA